MRRAAVIAALLLAGCGSAGGTAQKGRSDRLVDFKKKPPYVNSLETDPDTGDLLITTNRGFYRVDPKTGKVAIQHSTITNKGKRATVGTFLELDRAADGSLVGSGHPDPEFKAKFPQYLGYLHSDDGGKTWTVVSRFGQADLHKIIFIHDKLYAWDAVLSAVIISTDGGKTFSEHFTPRGLIRDFEVDPEDPDRILAATDEQLFRSTDSGDTWRPILASPGIRLAWPTEDKLYVATQDGRLQLSPDGGDTYRPIGKVDGEPWVIKAESPDELLMALSDASVIKTTDGGKTWKDVFRP
jgi:hypothetical protein